MLMFLSERLPPSLEAVIALLNVVRKLQHRDEQNEDAATIERALKQ